jgi:NAD(P)-dependent dehydrogenase (short-subunit alcohol dehydrogenase family)
VPVVSDAVGEMLDETAPQEDVQNLHAPTDGQHRQIGIEGSGQQSDFTLVPLSVHPRRGRIRIGPVTGRVHISPAHENQGIENGDDSSSGRTGAARAVTRGQEQRPTAHGGHAIDVGRRKHGRWPPPRTPRRLLTVRGDPDEGSFAGGHRPSIPPVRPRPEVSATASVTAMAERLSGKVALITGAGSGIGRVAAELFASEGAAVVVADVVAGAADQTVATITSSGGRARAVTVDVADEEQVADMVAAAVDTFGALHVLFNNAGIFPGDDGGVLDTPPSTWDRVMQVNLKGVWLGCRAAVPAMIDSGGGSIVNVASFVALMGAATAQVAYTASKGGVLAFTRELAVEYARSGIRANSLCPGPIDTPLLAELLADPVRRQRRLIHVPMGRLGRPEEIARAALFLASDDSSFMTGSALVVDGGITAAYVTPE